MTVTWGKLCLLCVWFNVEAVLFPHHPLACVIQCEVNIYTLSTLLLFGLLKMLGYCRKLHFQKIRGWNEWCSFIGCVNGWHIKSGKDRFISWEIEHEEEIIDTWEILPSDFLIQSFFSASCVGVCKSNEVKFAANNNKNFLSTLTLSPTRGRYATIKVIWVV